MLTFRLTLGVNLKEEVSRVGVTWVVTQRYFLGVLRDDPSGSFKGVSFSNAFQKSKSFY